MSSEKTEKTDAMAGQRLNIAPVEPEEAMLSPDVPKLYANGFTLGLGNADTYILFQRFGRPVAVVNLSYTLAKTLHQKLGQMIASFEAGVSREMLTTDQVDKIFQGKK